MTKGKTEAEKLMPYSWDQRIEIFPTVGWCVLKPALNAPGFSA